MSDFHNTLNRVRARYMGRAVPTRTSSELSSDPDVTIGIATIKIVTEEQIQAIAFGSLDGEPEVVVRVDPIGRDVSDLKSFADFMDRTAKRVLEAGGDLRVWIPHSVTLEALDVLGHRYWRNQNASNEIMRMGEICRIVAHEATFPGQQTVADAAALLRGHVVTGLAPIEEGHLGAMLAWLDPVTSDPLAEARNRIRLPASGVLPNTPDYPLDDRVDFLRKKRKGATGHFLAALEKEIESILRRWVLREWQLLVEARRAFWQLDLSQVGLDELVKDSRGRIGNALEYGHFPARRPDKLAVLLAQMEAGLEKAELASLKSDPVVRDHAVRSGEVVRGAVSEVRQSRRKFKPCDIDVSSDQSVIRLRIDDKIGIVGTPIRGIVRAISATSTGGTKVSIEITDGVRQTDVLSVDSRVDVMREGYGFVNHRAFGLVSQRRPWVFFDDGVPAIVAGQAPARSALEIAAESRRS